MKKLLFGLIATVMFAFTGNAQEMTKEEARVLAAKSFVSFKNQLTDAYKNSTTYSSFEKNVCGSWTNTDLGRSLLNEVYNNFKGNISNDKIISTYDGISITKALNFQQELLIKNPKSDGSELFGGPGDGSKVSYNASGSYPCKWYQIRCHLTQLVGEQFADAIIQAALCALLGIC